MERARAIEILRRADAKGWSLSELARRAHVRRNTLSAIVNGRTCPQRRTLEKLADALGTTPEVLMPPAPPGSAADQRSLRDAEPDTRTDWIGHAVAGLSDENRRALGAFVRALMMTGDVDAAAIAARASVPRDVMPPEGEAAEAGGPVGRTERARAVAAARRRARDRRVPGHQRRPGSRRAEGTTGSDSS